MAKKQADEEVEVFLQLFFCLFMLGVFLHRVYKVVRPLFRQPRTISLAAIYLIILASIYCGYAFAIAALWCAYQGSFRTAGILALVTLALYVLKVSLEYLSDPFADFEKQSFDTLPSVVWEELKPSEPLEEPPEDEGWSETRPESVRRPAAYHSLLDDDEDEFEDEEGKSAQARAEPQPPHHAPSSWLRSALDDQEEEEEEEGEEEGISTETGPEPSPPDPSNWLRSELSDQEEDDEEEVER